MTAMRLVIIMMTLTMCSSDVFAGRIIEGVVKAVYDGDTVLLATREDSRLKLRLYGVDAPETEKPDVPGQPFGDISKRTLAYKIMGRRVLAEIMDVDQYKRVVGIIRYAGRDINREMVSEGMVWAYRPYLQGVYASEYIGGENRARSNRNGLWRDNKPQSPWEFRKIHGTGQHLR
jgi:micrococcal nuclease